MKMSPLEQRVRELELRDQHPDEEKVWEEVKGLLFTISTRGTGDETFGATYVDSSVLRREYRKRVEQAQKDLAELLQYAVRRGFSVL